MPELKDNNMAKEQKNNALIDDEEIIQHKANFDENGENFWDKIKRYGIYAGSECIYYALLLYYSLSSEETPSKYKVLIYGALGYFISPLDLVSDLLPVVGYLDDISVLVGVLMTIKSLLTDKIIKQAKDKLEELGLKSDFDSKI